MLLGFMHKELLGVSWKEIKIAEIEDYVKEGLEAFRKLADKYRTPLSIY